MLQLGHILPSTLGPKHWPVLSGYNSETVFKLYSITKVFTALAGLQVCEKACQGGLGFRLKGSYTGSSGILSMVL